MPSGHPFQVLLWRNLATVVVELGSGRMPGILSHRSEHESFNLVNKLLTTKLASIPLRSNREKCVLGKKNKTRLVQV